MDLRFQLIEDIIVQYKDEINHPSISMDGAISWYHHYLQHPSHSHLKKTMRSVIYWKGIHNIIWSWDKSCKSYQKHETQPKVWSFTKTKLVMTTPLSTLHVDFISQYTLKGKDKTSFKFMCLTMFDPTTSWFNIIQLPTVTKFTVPNMDKGRKATCILTWENIFHVKVFFPHLSQKR